MKSIRKKARQTFIIFALIIILSVLPIIMSASNIVYATSREGHWIDFTWYYFSGGRTLVIVNHTSSVDIGDKWISDYVRRIIWQNFGGVVNYNGVTDLCNGIFDWLKGSTYYQDDHGQHSIYGWRETPTWCNLGMTCRNYYSDTEYWTYSYSPRGVFQSQTKFGNSCFPNIGPIHTIDFGF